MLEPGLPIGSLKLISQHERQRNLIHLQAATNRAAIDPGILLETAVRLLLHFEKIGKRAIGPGTIAHRKERRGHLIKIARPHRMITANRRLVGVGPAAPGNRWRGDRKSTRLNSSHTA